MLEMRNAPLNARCKRLILSSMDYFGSKTKGSRDRGMPQRVPLAEEEAYVGIFAGYCAPPTSNQYHRRGGEGSIRVGSGESALEQDGRHEYTPEYLLAGRRIVLKYFLCSDESFVKLVMRQIRFMPSIHLLSKSPKAVVG